ncbi:hypothetical protein LUZ60_017730 [Juncus effusus]|nr:hypothetical protein LUZ60_017730 [Juncus effusus]
MLNAISVEDVVTKPLDLHERVEEHAAEENSVDLEIKKIFTEIKSKVEHTKDIPDEIKEWRDDLVDFLGEMEQRYTKLLEDKEGRTTTELKVNLNEINKMGERVTSPKELHTSSSAVEQQNSRYETGQPSYTKPPHSTFEIGKPSNTKMIVERVEKGDTNVVKSQSSTEKPSKHSITQQADESEGTSLNFIDNMLDILDPQLRRCLYCLSIFPKGSVIKRRLLVYWWIGLKLVCPKGNNTAEQVGGLLFNELVNKGILIPHMIRRHNDVVDQCMIEPIIHKKLISSEKRKRFISKVQNFNSLNICNIQKNKLEVQTILNINQTHLKSDVIISRNGVKNMAVMEVGQWRCVDCHHIEADKTDFLNDLGPNLTYLSLRGISGISELPESIGNSTSLMILDIRACHNLENLPPIIKSLKNLAHLDVSECYLLDHIPRWVCTLNNLEVFKGFIIGSSGNKNRCKFSDISGLQKLRKLNINIGRDSEVSAEELSSLENLSNLRSLTITWGIYAEEREPETNLVNISPPKNLEKLELIGFPRDKAPEWLSPTKMENLKRLYIRGGMFDELGCNNTKKVWLVETLRLRFLRNLKKINKNDLRNLFPYMKYFEWLDEGTSGELKGFTGNVQELDKFYNIGDEYLFSSQFSSL